MMKERYTVAIAFIRGHDGIRKARRLPVGGKPRILMKFKLKNIIFHIPLAK